MMTMMPTSASSLESRLRNRQRRAVDHDRARCRPADDRAGDYPVRDALVDQRCSQRDVVPHRSRLARDLDAIDHELELLGEVVPNQLDRVSLVHPTVAIAQQSHTRIVAALEKRVSVPLPETERRWPGGEL